MYPLFSIWQMAYILEVRVRKIVLDFYGLAKMLICVHVNITFDFIFQVAILKNYWNYSCNHTGLRKDARFVITFTFQSTKRSQIIDKAVNWFVAVFERILFNTLLVKFWLSFLKILGLLLWRRMPVNKKHSELWSIFIFNLMLLASWI